MGNLDLPVHPVQKVTRVIKATRGRGDCRAPPQWRLCTVIRSSLSRVIKVKLANLDRLGLLVLQAHVVLRVTRGRMVLEECLEYLEKRGQEVNLDWWDLRDHQDKRGLWVSVEYLAFTDKRVTLVGLGRLVIQVPRVK